MSPSTPLETRLRELMERLEAGDVLAAESLMNELGPLLTGPLATEQLEQLQVLHRRCEDAAQQLQHKLTGEIRQSGASRRALGAYGQSQIPEDLF